MNYKKIALAATGTAAGSFAIANTVFKKIDPRIRSVISFCSGLYLIAFYADNKFATASGTGLMISSILDGLNSIRGGAISENKHNGYIWALMENGQTLRKLKPYETTGIIEKIDGIATSFKPNYVYKVPTACMVKILSNGDVMLSSSISRLINNKLDEKAGWKDYSYIENNPEWQKLYEKSFT